MANDKILSHNTQKLLEQISAKRQRYIAKSDKKANRSLDLDPDINNLYEVLVTLIKDLQKQKILD